MTEQNKPPEDMGFPPEILTQPMAVKLAYFQNKLIAHPLLKDAYDKLIRTIYHPAGSSLIWVVGPTGVGKTTLLRKTVKQMIENARQDMENDPGFLPLVSVGLQDVSAERGIFDWKDFFKCLLRAQNEPLIESKINYDPSLGPLQKSLRRTSTLADLRGAVKECFRNRRPIAIFLDEAQHFKKVGSGYSYLNQMDNIKALAEMTNAVYVLVLQRDITSAVPVIGQEVACDGSNRRHSYGVADTRSKPRPQADLARAGARRPSRASVPERCSAASRGASPGQAPHLVWARDRSLWVAGPPSLWFRRCCHRTRK